MLRIDDSIAGIGMLVSASGFTGQQNADLVLIPPSGDYAVFPLTIDETGKGEIRVPGTSVETAGEYRAFLGSGGERLSSDTVFQVLPDSVDTEASSLSANRRTLRADSSDAVTVTVALQDRYGNPLSDRPVELRANPASVVIEEEQRDTDEMGEKIFTVTASREGSFTLRAIDLLSNTLLTQVLTMNAGATSTSPSPYAAQLIQQAEAALPTANVAFGKQTGFEVTVEPRRLNINDLGNLTIRAVDADGNTVEDYAGTADISCSTDPDAILPGFSDRPKHGSVEFISKNLGRKFLPLSVSFKRTGRHILHVEDTADSSLSGEILVTVTPEGATDLTEPLTITSHTQNGTIRETIVTVEGVGQPYTTVEITGGVKKATGDTDDRGLFSIPVTLDPTYNEYTLHISDNVGDEYTLHLVRDADPPVITSATYAPEGAQEGTQVLLVVQGEPGLSDVKMRLSEQEYTLAEDDLKPGVYQLLFTAPAMGTYHPSILSRDTAGNRSELLTTFTVSPSKLPMVKRVKVKAQAAGVDLSWDLLTTETVDHYRVYVGETPEEFGNTLDTPDAAQAEATVTGLKGGVTYYFAVTAVQGERESDKSEIVSTRALGLSLTLTPQDAALLAEWSLPGELSIDSFRIEYGVSPDKLSEVRTMKGGDMTADEKRSLTLRDLLPGVTYYVKVTPVAATGDPLPELTAAAEGSPLQPGAFHAAPPDMLPEGSGALIGFDDTLAPAAPEPPLLERNGLPSFVWWTAGVAGAAFVLFVAHSRSNRKNNERFLRAMEARYHS